MRINPLIVGIALAAASACLGQGAPQQAWMQLIPGFADKPTAADLNGDGLLEVVVATVDGKILALDGSSGAKLWTVSKEDGFSCCPLVEDVDGDGSVEVIVTGGRTGLVLCLNGEDGSEQWTVPGGRDGLPGNGALADLDGNGRKELYIAQGENLRAIDAAGGAQIWTAPAGERMRGAVSVADIDGGGAEILVGCDAQQLICFTGDGGIKWRASVRGQVTKAPVICDQNNDGQAEIYAVGGAVARIDSRGNTVWQWAAPSGRGLASSLAAEDVNGDGQTDFVITGYDGKVYAIGANGRAIWSYVVSAPDRGEVKYIPSSTPALIDINGDGGADLIMGSPRPDAPKTLAISGKNGKALWSTTIHAFSQCSPLVADVTGDKKAELIVCAASGRLYCYKLARNAARGWVKYGGDLGCTNAQASARATSAALLASQMPFRVSRQTVSWSNLIGGTPPAGGAVTPPTVTPRPTTTTPSGTARPDSDIAVLLDGNWLQLEPAPIMVGGSVLVPLRGIFEAMGAEVKFEAGTITATKETTTVVLKLGSAMANVNGQAVTLSVPAQSISGSTFVPLRFIGEAFGATVKWDAAGKNVEIQT